MPWLAGGILGVLLLALAMGGLANAKPAQIARVVRWVALVSLVALGVVFLSRRIYVLAFLSFGAASIAWQSIRGGARTAPGRGRTSEVETEWVRMSLDLDSGATTGVVLKGAYTGSRLEGLSLAELRAVLTEARINDPDAARLIEAFIARSHPEAEPEAANDAGTKGMSRDEALEVLGLAEGATADEIREAHRRLMQKVHPDLGGSDYLAAKINAARDLLLKDM
jgi:hypothetical protein